MISFRTVLFYFSCTKNEQKIILIKCVRFSIKKLISYDLMATSDDKSWKVSAMSFYDFAIKSSDACYHLIKLV